MRKMRIVSDFIIQKLLNFQRRFSVIIAHNFEAFNFFCVFAQKRSHLRYVITFRTFLAFPKRMHEIYIRTLVPSFDSFFCVDQALMYFRGLYGLWKVEQTRATLDQSGGL